MRTELPRTPLVLLAVITTAGAALRLHGLGGGLWFDEIWMLTDLVRLPFSELATTYGSDNNHPLYTWSAWVCVRLFGESAVALRLPAFLFGTASIPALWFLGRRVVGRDEALAAAALLAASYHGVWFSQNARGYAHLLFFAIVSTTMLLETLEGDRRAWLGWAIALALATWTHQTAIFLAVPQYMVAAGVTLFGRPPSQSSRTRSDTLKAMIAAPALSLGLHAPILGEMAAFLRPGEGHEIVTSSWTSPAWMVREAAAAFGIPAFAAWFALASAGAVGAVGVVSLWRRDPRIPLLFLLPCLVGGATMFAMQRNLWPRFFFFAAGFLLLVAVRSATLMVPWSGARRVLAALVIAATCLHGWTAGSLPKQDFESARRWIDAHRSARSAVVTVGMASFVYEDYLRLDWSSANSVTELEAAARDRSPVFVVTTMPGHLESRHPDLATRLGTAIEVARFRGSVGGGDVVIHELK